VHRSALRARILEHLSQNRDLIAYYNRDWVRGIEKMLQDMGKGLTIPIPMPMLRKSVHLPFGAVVAPLVNMGRSEFGKHFTRADESGQQVPLKPDEAWMLLPNLLERIPDAELHKYAGVVCSIAGDLARYL
jgi:hypothetical protein